MIFFKGQHPCGEILLNAEFAIFKTTAIAQGVGNVLLGNILAGSVNNGLAPLFDFRRKFDILRLLLLARQPYFFRIFGSEGKLLHLRQRGCSFNWNNEFALLDKFGNFCGYSIPCQIDLCCFGEVIALPKFKVHIMPDKTYEMVVHEQICINLLVAMLTIGAALGKVGVLRKIFQYGRIIGATTRFLCQQAHNQFFIQRGQVGNRHRKSGERQHALRLGFLYYRL